MGFPCGGQPLLWQNATIFFAKSYERHPEFWDLQLVDHRIFFWCPWFFLTGDFLQCPKFWDTRHHTWIFGRRDPGGAGIQTWTWALSNEKKLPVLLFSGMIFSGMIGNYPVKWGLFTSLSNEKRAPACLGFLGGYTVLSRYVGIISYTIFLGSLWKTTRISWNGKYPAVFFSWLTCCLVVVILAMEFSAKTTAATWMSRWKLGSMVIGSMG